MTNIKGTVYLLHFDRPLSHAQHYCGWSGNPRDRAEIHGTSAGAKLTFAAKQAGITWTIAREWEQMTRHFERRLKRQRQFRKLCPICSGDKALGRGKALPEETAI